MQAVAEPELSAGALWQPDWSHDLAHTAAAAAEPAAHRHPTRRAGEVGAELEWPWIDG